MAGTKAKRPTKARKAGDIDRGMDLPPDAQVAKTVTKTADNKGRVVLGSRFANRAVIIEKLNETEIIVKLARVIPEKEAWLYENAQALAAVRTGLAEARAGKVTRGPDVGVDSKFATKLEG
ncbi:MAG TPA: hypothetical protein VIM11_23010 [Tepidisphaeraceae bacterium]|jgi:hypothetical protein